MDVPGTSMGTLYPLQLGVTLGNRVPIHLWTVLFSTSLGLWVYPCTVYDHSITEEVSCKKLISYKKKLPAYWAKLIL